MGGGVTRFGAFIRSDMPAGLTGEDKSYLKAYGVRTAVDLRSESEVAAISHSLRDEPWVKFRAIPFTEDFTILGSDEYCPLHHIVPIMEGSHNTVEVLRFMADAPEGAVMFNCTAGKDRTGIIAVILLLIAGVPEPDIIADYQVTYFYIKSKVDAMQSPTRDKSLCRTEPEWIIPLLDYIRERGGIKEYLKSLGAEEDIYKKLRARILE